MANTLLTEQAFAGVNYMEKLGTLGKQTPFDASQQLIPASDQGFLQHNVDSIMNKFTVFQYAPLNAGSVYRPEGHFIGFTSNLKSSEDYERTSNSSSLLNQYLIENSINAGQKSQDQIKELERRLEFYQSPELGISAKRFAGNNAGVLSNPTANRLIKWGAEISGGTLVGFQPYSHTDFMYCKYYGKIPNNRLITLRRYPFPIGDSIRIGGPGKNAMPVAQAVTWFGGETTNTLNSLGVFNWDIPWKMDVQVIDGVTGQTIEGNEITLDEMLNLLANVPGGDKIQQAIKAAYVGINGTDEQLQQASRYEAQIQKYQRNLYDRTSGPYWNRIYGPVNVIAESSMRERGVQTTWGNNLISLKFHYSFRSFNGMSPKIAALEIISNFMNLTYQDAQFLGQLSRYFPKLGVKFSPNVTEAIGNILSNWGTTYSGNNSQAYATVISNLVAAVKQAGSKIISNPAGVGAGVIQAGLMSKNLLGGAIPELISIKSALSDRPVGEWHLVVGNPMNPIFVMGDLLCTDVKMTWDDEIGPDDFPTGVTFTVTLKQGKPRDKTAIERMLNHGQTKLTSGALRTSSAEDTFGETNNDLYKTVTDSATYELKLQESYSNLGKKAGTYLSFRDRFLKGYGFSVPANAGANGPSAFGKDGIIDDSLLLLYYQRQYGNN